MATAKQIAARKLFVRRVKAGEFKRKPAAKRAKNPTQKPESQVVVCKCGESATVPAYMDLHFFKTHKGVHNVCRNCGGINYLNRKRGGEIGILKHEPAIKKNPAKKTAIKRAGVPAKKYESRPSQITRAAPTKRLKARRKANVKQGVPGYFPNPVLPFRVQQNIAGSGGTGKGWSTVASFAKKSDAITYAKAFAKAALMYTAVRVIDNK